MKKILNLLVFVFAFIGFFVVSGAQAFAQNSCQVSVSPTRILLGDTARVSISNLIIDGQPISNTQRLSISIDTEHGLFKIPQFTPSQNGVFSFDVDAFTRNRVHRISVIYYPAALNPNIICTAFETVSTTETCSISHVVTRNEDGTFNLGVSVDTSQLDQNSSYTLVLDTGIRNTVDDPFNPSESGNTGFSAAYLLDNGHNGNRYNLFVKHSGCNDALGICIVNDQCQVSVFFDPNAPLKDDDNVLPSPPATASGYVNFQVCNQVRGNDKVQCNNCFDSEGIWTAIGCIPFKNTVTMVRALLTVGLGVGGGVVVLMILAGSFILSTSQGDPKRVDEAKGMITSAVMGLVFVIFSITILRFIGVRILQIPGFGQ